jgi:DNA-binding NarL/FixJ family response regulator
MLCRNETTDQKVGGSSASKLTKEKGAQLGSFLAPALKASCVFYYLVMANSGETNKTSRDVVSVVVADDDRLTALTLADSIGRYGIRTLATVHTARDAIAAAIELKPNVLVVDLDFGPGPTGIDVAVTVRRALPTVGVVIVTAYEDSRLLSPGLPAAPAGSLYLVKQQVVNPEQVATAVRLSRETALDPPSNDNLRKRMSLTDSQIELLRLVATGLSNQAIAETMNLTPETVKKAITRLAKRVRVDHSSDSNLRVGLAHVYLQHSGFSRG